MRKLDIPLTLERAGSEGKFFTDNMILKLMGCTFLAFILSLIIAGQIGSKLPTLISLIIGGILFFVQETVYVRFFVLKERTLIPLLDKMIKYRIVDTNKFYDIYSFIDNVALHNSGDISLFIEIVRGSTIGCSEQELDGYYDTIQRFENSILEIGYKIKDFDFESKDFKRDKDIMLNQVKCAKGINENLAHNLSIRYKYTEAFMESAMRKDRLIYVIISKENDTEQFFARIKQAVTLLNHSIIRETMFLSESQVYDFAKEFFNTKLFNTSLTTEEDLFEVLKFNKE